ncbi:Amino acid transporter transmembrane [Penicillium cf. griseofulvum]|uniref:Amino acid transporter transmembrane n=1 Tax=Penicillium cf. griseofulvum TaxID=2972120 RepID=A0A9W9T2M4_9EURO|nr:Amino acid transporter transmembrane [Penicillium cf. griseofulvum]KAJ5446266.1 Amino acid transporter transmembrane [Penicillium cf. griseofulvum]KAJ5448009.1 Amino acid transporter transmembrane [Penicillium cf. griseofulvum]
MADNGEGSSLNPARSMPIASSSVRSRSPAPDFGSRQASIARLASPVPSPSLGTSLSSRQSIPASRPVTNTTEQEFSRSVANPSSIPGPGHSIIASQLQESLGRSPPRFGTPSRQNGSPAVHSTLDTRPLASQYGSFDTKNGSDSPGMAPYEDPEVIKRHLVTEHTDNQSEIATSLGGEDNFSSLQLQGGDITRQVYRWAEDAEAEAAGRFLRSKSFSVSRPRPETDIEDIDTIRVPGGFRRDYLRRAAGSPHRGSVHGSNIGAPHGPGAPQLPTTSFLEFLTLYGHFAGEELEEDDEVLGPDEYFSSDTWDEPEEGRESGEDAALLQPETSGRKKRKHKQRSPPGTTTTTGAVLLLLKSFVGTGILFLPRAFLNGGMLFSSMVLLGVSILSYYAFILLVNTRMKIEGSFGDIGGILYGKHMRRIILGSIVLSQIGFVAAYIVFVSQNLQAFVLAVSKCVTFIDVKYMVLLQLVIFLPLSLIRDISKLGFTALIADVFILLGLLYIYYYDISTLVDQGGISDVVSFNPATWSMFIGTAIFTYEGIGLIIPIQESMKQPNRFPGVLAGVMVLITFIFLSAGALSYAAYGSATKTVILLNLPQDDKFVNVVQFLYSLAILLSTPLQLFPAIRIMENELFTRSGKYNPYIKWKKNGFRFFLVMVCALIAWCGANDLDKFVSLVGSFACVPLIYVYPPLLHLRACARSKRQAIADVTLAVFGAICCVYTTYLTLMSWMGPEIPQSPGYCDSH